MTNPPGGSQDPYGYGQPYGQQPQDPGYGGIEPYSGQPYSGQPYSAQPYAGQPYQPYPTAGYQTPPRKGMNTMAILALVLAFSTGIGGIICGHIAKKQIKETGEEGEGLATAGLVIGYIQTGILALTICILPIFCFGGTLCLGANSGPSAFVG